MGKACGCITLSIYTYIANSLIYLTVVLTVSATIVSSVSSFISSSMSWFFWATLGLPIKDQAIAFGLSWPFGLGSVVAHAASFVSSVCLTAYCMWAFGATLYYHRANLPAT
jgi:hypothetical protein